LILIWSAPLQPPAPTGTPDEVARDETYWRDVQQAFTLDRTLLNLNNGGSSPAPRVVLAALERAQDLANLTPAHYQARVLEPGLETTRRLLAEELGCDRGEVALTRNASEALQIVQLGLDLAPGDEVLTTNQDYSRMLDTWSQRARRNGIRLVTIPFPVPLDDPERLVPLFARAITRRTKVIHFCHVTARTGQIFPAKSLCDLARQRGIQTIVDGAHSFAQLPFSVREIGCDYFASSLHKWLQAPTGTGVLFVGRERIRNLWPLQPAPERLSDDIRKFEDVGTRPAAPHHAIAEAIAFHRAVGLEHKAARLRFLRDRWFPRLARHRRVRALTSTNPAASCGIASIRVLGIEPERLTAELWDRERIIVLPIWHRDYRGIRVTPAIYTTPAEVDRFADALEQILREPIARFQTPARPAVRARES
jgi:selenocysteine lyase/cysteine desulfurase